MVVVRLLRALWSALCRGLNRLLGRPPAPQQQPPATPAPRIYIPLQPQFLPPAGSKPHKTPAPPLQPATPAGGRPRWVLSTVLGSGGQGAVYELEGDPNRVMKQFGRPIPGVEEDFGRLMEAGPKITEPLAGLPITFCWPEEAWFEAGLVGYVMPKLGPRFYFEYGRNGKRKLRALEFAVPKLSVHPYPFTVSDTDRLVLVQLVAAVLESMHASGVVYGDLSWGNFAFAAGPDLRLAVFDMDSSRILGSRSFTRQPPARTRDWEDPMSPDLPVATLDADRYKFALLAFRLLVARNFDGSIAPQQVVGAIPGVGEEGTRQLKALWTRAAGPAGTRPQLAEWTRVLGRPLSTRVP